MPPIFSSLQFSPPLHILLSLFFADLYLIKLSGYGQISRLFCLGWYKSHRFLSGRHTLSPDSVPFIKFFETFVSKKYKKNYYECQDNVSKFWIRYDLLYKYIILGSAVASIDIL